MSGAAPIRLLHLYPDLLNLYGENGNVRVLAAALRSAGAEVEVSRLSLGDHLDLMDAALVYIGCGTEHNQLLALRHLGGFRQELVDYLGRGGLFLATGNAGDLFGSEIREVDGTSIPALGLFEHSSARLGKREVGEVLFRYGDNYLVGFQNRGSRIACELGGGEALHPLFTVEKGYPTDFGPAGGGNQPGGMKLMEGFVSGGFICTSVLGLLSRNPVVLACLCDMLMAGDAFAREGSDSVVGRSEERRFSPELYTTSDVGRYNLALDIVAFEAFLSHHHTIFANVTRR